MVIVLLYDRLNGYRYRKLSYDYFSRYVPARADYVVSYWIVPNTQEDR